MSYGLASRASAAEVIFEEIGAAVWIIASTPVQRVNEESSQ